MNDIGYNWWQYEDKTIENYSLFKFNCRLGGGCCGNHWRQSESCSRLLQNFTRRLTSSVADPTFFHTGFRIPDPNCFHPGSRIRINEFKYINSKKWFLSSRKYDPGCSSLIPDPDHDFWTIPDPGSRGQKCFRSRIPDSDPQHYMTKSCSDSSHIENIRLPYDDTHMKCEGSASKRLMPILKKVLWKILDEECCFQKLSSVAANRAAAEAVW